jgi:iron(III) transport system permease protein
VSLAPSVASPAGALLVVTLAYYPLVFLPVAAALDGLDGAWRRRPPPSGWAPGRGLRRVVLPQLRPAVLGGALLVSLHLLAEFGRCSCSA